MKSAETVDPDFVQSAESRSARRAGLSAGGAGDRRDAAAASPSARSAATIIALFCVALAWACVGRVDIVASAPGKIVPSGRTKVIQPFETGVVRAIHVSDGQSVKAGEVLIELDPTINQADSQHLEGDLVAAELDVARLTAALSDEPRSRGGVPSARRRNRGADRDAAAVSHA